MTAFFIKSFFIIFYIIKVKLIFTLFLVFSAYLGVWGFYTQMLLDCSLSLNQLPRTLTGSTGGELVLYQFRDLSSVLK